MLNDDEGIVYQTYEEISNVVVSYFQGLFGQKNSEVMECSQQFLEYLWTKKFDEVVARKLVERVQILKIK